MRHLEDDLANRVEAVIARDLGIQLGDRERRDGIDGSGLTVDFTYDATGHAMEITTTPDASTPDGVAASKLADRLSEEANGWIVVLNAGARMRDLDRDLLDLMCAGVGIRPAEYSSDDLERWRRQGCLEGELQRRKRLEKLGIVELVRQPSVDRVEAMVMGDLRTFGGTSSQLEHALKSNSEKLAACRPRRTHLVVGLAEFGVSRDPAATPVPELPSAIDDLWVLHLWSAGGERCVLWHAQRGDSERTVHDEES